MAKCNDCGSSTTQTGLCTRCDMHRREMLPPGCPPIVGEYRPGNDSSVPLHGGFFCHEDLCAVVGVCCPPKVHWQGHWDDVVRVLEEDR